MTPMQLVERVKQLEGALQAIVTEECAKLAVTLIAKKAIPAVSITY